MRLLRTRSLAFALPLLLLAACGGAKSTVTPVPSAASLPVIATDLPTATDAASAIAPRATVPGVTIPLLVATPTPLASASVAPAGRSTPVPTKPASPVPATAAPRPSQAVATTQAAGARTDRIADIPTGAPQQTIGGSSDGLTLLNVRSGKDNGFTRLVFDLSKQDGSAAPVPRTRLWVQGGTVIVAFGGVRDDVYATSLGGGEQAVNIGMVQSVYRIPIRDDTAAAYGIAVSGSTRVTLSSASLPTRVIVDIADK
ncbi:MAG: hypothetical protein ACR2JW_16745 [Thermomicrobiales bacterium]